MNPREKLAVTLGGAMVLLTGIYFLLIAPPIEKSKRLDRMIVQREKEIDQIRELRKEYLTYKGKLEILERRLQSIGKGFSSLAFLENIAQKTKVRDKITAITPLSPIDVGDYRGKTLEVKMEGLPLDQIVEYLYRIENSEYWMRISRLSLKTRFGTPDIFDAKFTVVSFAKA